MITDDGFERWPRWAVLFYGNRYLLFFVGRFPDSRNSTSRPAFFCSPILDVGDARFPLPAAILYMALSSDPPLSQETLLEKLEIPTPDPPPPLPDPSAPRRATSRRNLSKVTRPLCKR